MIYIVKNKKGKFLIGEGGKVKTGFRLKNPYEIVKTAQGISIEPYDIAMVDTIIPYIDFTDETMEYNMKTETNLANFYTEKSTEFLKEIKARETREPKE